MPARRSAQYRPARRFRLTRHLSLAAVAVIACAVSCVGLVYSSVLAVAAAGADSSLTCASNLIYGSTNTGDLVSIDTETAAVSTVATMAPDTDLNALGITASGLVLTAVSDGGTAGSNVTIYEYDPVSGLTTTYDGGPLANDASNAHTIYRGGVNLSNGIYYFTTARASDNSIQDIYAFNTRTNANIGYVGSVQVQSDANQGGDLVFDPAGNMLVVVQNQSHSANYLDRVTDVPTTAGTRTLSYTQLSVLPAGVFVGVAFAPDGYLYMSSNTSLYKVDASTGTTATILPLANSTITDLSSCTSNGAITLEKNIAGRAAANDQFDLSITGGGISAGNTGTTTGNSTGLQTGAGEIAGPVIALPGTTYTLTETAVAGSLADYTRSMSCVDTANENASVATTSTGTGTWSLAFPTGQAAVPDIVCTATNTPIPAQLSTTKSIATVNGNAATSSTTLQAGNVIVYHIATTNTGGEAGSATLTETVPADTSYTGTGQGWSNGCTTAGTSCTRSVTVPAAGTTTADFTVTVTSPLPPDTASITNSVTADGSTCAPEACTVTNPVQAPGLSLVKSASPTSVTAAGQVVHYSFAVTNTGNVTISDLLIVDSEFSGTGSLPAISCPTTTLAPADSTTCTASYTVTQTDVDAGTITNTAVAAGTPPGSGPAVSSAPSSATVTAPHHAALTLVKTATSGGSAVTSLVAGEPMTYHFAVTNTGNVTMRNLAIDDNRFSGTGALSTISCPATTLAPGGSTTCTASYTVTQADVTAKAITNTATATGTAPGSTTPITSDPSTVAVPGAQRAALQLVKTASLTTITGVGQQIVYRFVITNTGTVELTSVHPNEVRFSGSGALSAISCPSIGQPLAPGYSDVCTATYAVTAKDLAAGGVTNVAVADGRDPGGASTTTSPRSSAIVRSTAPPLKIDAGGGPEIVTRSRPYLGLAGAMLAVAALVGFLVMVRRRRSRA